MSTRFELYTRGNSFIYRLDPRTKIVGVLVVFALSVMFTSPVFLSPVFLSIFLIVILGKVPLRKVGAFLKLLIVLVLISLALWPFILTCGSPLAQVGPFRMTDQGLIYGIGMTFRIADMVVAPIVLMLTTTQPDLVKGLRGLGLPFKGAFALSTAFRFVPTVFSVGTTINEAQRARGLNVNEGGPIERVKKQVAILGPLLITSIRTSQQLVLAVEARGFSSPIKRTQLHPLHFETRDQVALLLLAICFLVAVSLRVAGLGLAGC